MVRPRTWKCDICRDPSATFREPADKYICEGCWEDYCRPHNFIQRKSEEQKMKEEMEK